MGRDEDGLLLLMRKVFEQEQNLDSVRQVKVRRGFVQ